MERDRARWDDRYGGREAATAAAPDIVVRHPELAAIVPRTGRALDVACGTGAQTLWLARHGLDVVALDVSPVAIDLVRAGATAAGYARAVDARVHDTDGGLPDDLTDLAAIVCQRYRAPELYGEFVDRLRIGGVLILTVLSAVGVDDTPGQFHAPPGELTAAFDRDDVRIVLDEEADGLASVVLERVSPDA